MIEYEMQLTLTTLAQLGCFDDSCDVYHCSVCGRHTLASFVGYMPTEREGRVCETCQRLTDDEREYVCRARDGFWRVLYGEDKEASERAWKEIRLIHSRR